VAADGAAGATLNERTLSGLGDRALLGRDAAGVDGPAAAERRTFLAQDLAVSPAASATSHGAADRAARRAAADSRCRAAAAAGVAAQVGPTGHGWSRRLGRRVGAQRGAVATHDGAAALAADAQSSAARGAGASLTADANTAQGTGNVRSRSAIQRGTLAGDQSRLTGRTADERSVATGTCEAADVAGAGQAAACGKPGLTSQTGLAREIGLAANAGTGLASRAERTSSTKTALASESRLPA
jgi:hypothetical protein